MRRAPDLSEGWASVRRISGGGIMLIMLKLLQGRKANVVNGASSMAAGSAPFRRAWPLCESEPERIMGRLCDDGRSAQPGFAGVAVRPEKAVPPRWWHWEYTCNRRQQTRIANRLGFGLSRPVPSAPFSQADWPMAPDGELIISEIARRCGVAALPISAGCQARSRPQGQPDRVRTPIEVCTVAPMQRPPASRRGSWGSCPSATRAWLR